MKKIIFLLFLVFLALAAYFYRGLWWQESLELVSPFQTKPKSTALLKYSFESLRQREFAGSQIVLEKVIKQEEDFTAYLFSFQSDGKRVTGQANLPTTRSPAQRGEVWPVVVMIRGHVDDEVYFTGAGTYKVAAEFAKNGFLTLAPDFLGFGGSDTSSADILEARFERPVTILNLLASIKTLPQVEPEKVVIWAHSNGGQIALSVLEILGKANLPAGRQVPTTLWAPVTKGFPESVLTYMGQMDDLGTQVKTRIDEFLQDYDPKRYSIDQYFNDIQAPLQLHQGTADPLIPVAWSDTFVLKMESLGKKITYYKYRGNDHNLKQSWDLVIDRDLEFFRKMME